MSKGTINKVMLIGNIGKDPEIRYGASGAAIANFSLATTESWKDKTTGEAKEQTEWHRCNAFGKTAEVIGQYVKKGAKIFIEGRLQTRKWTDKGNVERYITEIIVENMQMLGGKSDKAANESNPSDEQFNDEIPF